MSHSVPTWTLILTSCLQLALCEDERRAKMTLEMHTYNFEVQLLECSGVCYLTMSGLFTCFLSDGAWVSTIVTKLSFLFVAVLNSITVLA